MQQWRELYRMFACIRRRQIIAANEKFGFQPLLRRNNTVLVTIRLIITRTIEHLITDDEADSATMQNGRVKSECFVGDYQHGLRVATATGHHVLFCHTFTDHPTYYCLVYLLLAVLVGLSGNVLTMTNEFLSSWREVLRLKRHVYKESCSSQCSAVLCWSSQNEL